LAETVEATIKMSRNKQRQKIIHLSVKKLLNPGANPTITSYNASVVKILNPIFFLTVKML
jgi:hypothetical protein